LVEKETTIENRKHKRFKAQKNTFVLIVNGSADIGQLINISRDGFAFRYIGKAEQVTGWHRVEIFISNKLFILENLPFRVISDYNLDTRGPHSTVLLKLCGGQFGELTSYQGTQIDHFIAHHTIGLVEMRG